MALRLAINGLGRVSAQLVRVLGAGGFSDLFEIVAIHDKAGPQEIVRALRDDSVYGPFPEPLVLEDDVLKIGEREITLSANDDGKNATWGKNDIPLVIVDGSAACDTAALDQHLKKGAKRVFLPAASNLADVNIGIGINESTYDVDKHTIVASVAGAPAAIAILTRLFDELGTLRSGSATVVAPASPSRSLIDTPAAAGGLRLWSIPTPDTTIYRQLLDQLSQRLTVTEIESPAQAVGSVSLSVWLARPTSLDAIEEAVANAEASDDLVGLIGTHDGLVSSGELIRDTRTFVLDRARTRISNDTFVSVTGWYDAEWAAACRLADTLALVCEEGVPDTA